MRKMYHREKTSMWSN